MNAEGSTTGAGGMGTMSPWPTAAPFAGASQPQAGAGAAQVGAAAAQPQPTAFAQPLQPLLQPQPRWQLNSRSSKQVRPQPQPLLHELWQPQPLPQPLLQHRPW